jgi:hypothetical protein
MNHRKQPYPTGLSLNPNFRMQASAGGRYVGTVEAQASPAAPDPAR